MDDQLHVKYIRTKNKVRKIVTYNEDSELREYHESVVRFLKHNTRNSIFAKAYMPGASIYKNASAHLYNDIFLKMDIKNFFPSMQHKYLAECLFYEINKKTEISRRECYEVVKSSSISSRGVPLGLVTAPALANLYLKEFDGLLYGALKKMGLKNPIYTRYADDMVVSFKYMDNYEEKTLKIQQLTAKLLKKFYLSLNEKKTKVYNLKISNHVKITGINITRDEDDYRHITVGRKLKNELFWSAIEQFDSEDKDFTKICYLKGMLSFVLSIEKKGMEDCYSPKMHKLILDRGYSSLRELIQAL